MLSDRPSTLLEALTGEREPSQHLRALRQRFSRRSGLDALRNQILGEMAAALGRAEEHITKSLKKLHDIGRQIAELEQHVSDHTASEELAERIRAFNAERARAEHRLWELTVHREALGLRRHDMLSEHYPLPAARKIPQR